jgi:hypothetical protein
MQRVFAAPRGAWRWLGSRRGRLTLLTLLPVVIVLVIPWLFGWVDPVSGDSTATSSTDAMRSVSAHELSELSKDLSALAAAILAAVIVVLREAVPEQRTRGFIKGVMATVFFAMISIYSCIRLRFGITRQLWENRLDLSRVDNLFFAQWLTLVIALSVLMLLAASVYIPRGSPGASQ